MTRASALLLVGLATIPGAAYGGVVEVQIHLPAPQKIDTTGMNRLLIGAFRTNDHPTLDLDREINRSFRDLMHRYTRFEVLEIEPLPLPEQPIDDAIRNTAYWKRLGARFGADIILGGSLEFTSRDQSGFVQEDYISEITGQRVRRTRWIEREAFKMDLGLYFFRGSSGDLLFEDHFTEEMALDGKANDQLSVLHELLERVHDGILSIVTPTVRVETRHLFTE